MDRRDFIKSILATSLAAPFIIYPKSGSPAHDLYLLSESPARELPILLNELGRLNLFGGQGYNFSQDHPQKKEIEAILKNKGWKHSALKKAELTISFNFLQTPVSPSFTLIQSGRLHDLRSEKLHSLWKQMQQFPRTRLLTLLSFIPSFSSPTPGQNLVIWIEGRVVERLPLWSRARRIIDTGFGRLTLVIETGRVRVENSTCRHQICVASSPISLSGERIICAPNQCLLEIEGRRWLDAVIG